MEALRRKDKPPLEMLSEDNGSLELEEMVSSPMEQQEEHCKLGGLPQSWGHGTPWVRVPESKAFKNSEYAFILFSNTRCEHIDSYM